MSVDAQSNLILQTPAPFFVPERAWSWRWLHRAVGQEMFGRRAGPWGIVFAPVPLVALLLGTIALLAPAGTLDGWLVGRLGELAWIGLLPFLLAACLQTVLQVCSDFIWRLSEGSRHLDYSPRMWHFQLGVAIAVLPLVGLQFSDDLLDLYLRFGLAIHTHLGGMKVPIASYDPGLVHLLVLGGLPALHWQVKRVVVKIPCGRILGLQRELARLRGAVAWQPDAWAMLVGDSFDRWLADIEPPDPEQPIKGERQRQHRMRWTGLRKEVIGAWQGTPPDLARANRALSVYRDGW
jgi:hypothetical protein